MSQHKLLSSNEVLTLKSLACDTSICMLSHIRLLVAASGSGDISQSNEIDKPLVV